MQFHGVEQTAVEILEVAEVAVHQVVQRLLRLFDPEVEQHVRPVVVAVVLRGSLDLQPPLQTPQRSDVLQLRPEDRLPDFLQVVSEFLWVSGQYFEEELAAFFVEVQQSDVGGQIVGTGLVLRQSFDQLQDQAGDSFSFLLVDFDELCVCGLLPLIFMVFSSLMRKLTA